MWLLSHRLGGVSVLPDPSVLMSGKCDAGGSVIVVVSPLILRMEDQCSKIESVTCSTYDFVPTPL